MNQDRNAPCSQDEDRARKGEFKIHRFEFRPPPLPNREIETPDVTQLERDTIRQLRDVRGFYVGDRYVLPILRKFVKESAKSPSA